MENEKHLGYNVLTIGESWNKQRAIWSKRIFSGEKSNILPQEIKEIYRNLYSSSGNEHLDYVYQFKDSLDTILTIKIQYKRGVQSDNCWIYLRVYKKNVDKKANELESNVRKFNDIFLYKHENRELVDKIMSNTLKEKFDSK